MNDAAGPKTVCFGPFRLDLTAGELCVDGQRIRLQEQPFQLLKMLLEHPGEVVTREEIRHQLWPNGTVVEFDHGINAVIKKLRTTLRDSAEQPRYVETVARRGYRFIAPVDMREETQCSPELEVVASRTPQGQTGKTVSHYRVMQILGSGGMGVVYKAEDLKLGRQVAVKFLPEELGTDPKAVERFEGEARAASTLDHPNICTIHEFGEYEGQAFLVMPLLEGKTLRDRMAEGVPLPIPILVDLAIQIADGLEAAHVRGIIHGDIKPANLFITTRGQVKILDFGVAKLAITGHHVKAAIADGTETATIDVTSTQGSAVGTPGYMSPEQVRGQSVDTRTDLFSLGIVLYELATGKMPFEGQIYGAVMGAILHETPVPPSRINPEVPLKLEEIINKALEKDRDLRYQHASDLRRDLKRLKRDSEFGQASSSTGVRALPAPPKRRWIFPTGSAVAIIVAAVIGSAIMRPLPQPRIVATTQITNEGGTTIAYVTDGTRLYYTLWAAYRDFENFQISAKGGESVPLPDSTRGMILQDISPDKAELLFLKRGGMSLDAGPSQLWAAPVLGRTLRRLGDLVANFGAAWAPDGQELVYIKGRELYTATRDGVEIKRLAVVTGTPTGPVHWSPDGRTIRFDVQDASEVTSIWEISTDGTNLHALLPGWHRSHCCGSWTADGRYFVFTSGGNIWAMREKTGLFQTASRQPMQLTTGPMELEAPIPSPDTKRIFAIGRHRRTELGRYDSKSGQFLPYLGGISAEGLDFSSDGTRLAYVLYPEATLWRANADGHGRQQLTFPTLSAGMPRWSPDGKQIALEGALPGKSWRIYLLSSEGGTPQQVTNGESGDAGDFDPVWSPDGSFLAFGGNPFLLHTANKLIIHVLDTKTHQVSALPGSEGLWSPRWSPSGNYIAALSARNERLMLYDLQTHGQTVLTTGDLGYPSWSHDSEFVYFDTIGTDPAFFRVRIHGRSLERIVSLNDVRRTLGTFGPWTGLGPDNSLLIQRVAGSNEIYALDWDAP